MAIYSMAMDRPSIISWQLGKGEAACLSLAANRNLKVLRDDLDTRRAVVRAYLPGGIDSEKAISG